MDVNELNLWVETSEGKAWLESQKQPLLLKRDELLSELKSASGKLSELELRSKQTENILTEERTALTSALVDQELTRLLKQRNIYESVIPSVAATLKETYGISIKADGPNRKAYGTDGKEAELSLNDIVSAWSKTPEAKQVTPHSNSGGGATPGYTASQPSISPELNNLSGRQLANTSDSDFEAWRQSELQKAQWSQT